MNKNKSMNNVKSVEFATIATDNETFYPYLKNVFDGYMDRENLSF